MYIYGASGHGKVVLMIAKSLNIQVNGFIDDNLQLNQFNGYPVKRVNELVNLGNPGLIIAIGDNIVRERIIKGINHKIYVSLVHPRAVVCKSAIIKEGSIIMPGAVVNIDTTIGSHCIINSGAVIEHDCTIENFVHVSPNASIAGGVHVGRGSQVGIGSSIKQGIKIGKNVIIGAGAVIIKDIPDNAVVVGVPGKILRFQ